MGVVRRLTTMVKPPAPRPGRGRARRRQAPDPPDGTGAVGTGAVGDGAGPEVSVKANGHGLTHARRKYAPLARLSLMPGWRLAQVMICLPTSRSQNKAMARSMKKTFMITT